MKKSSADDFWMGIVELLKLGSPVKGGSASILVNSATNSIIAQTFDTQVGKYSNKYVSSDWVIFDKTVEFSSSILYTTHTPAYDSCLNIIRHNVRKVVYRKTESLVEEINDICRTVHIKFQAFDGNLTWIQDHALFLKPDITFGI